MGQMYASNFGGLKVGGQGYGGNSSFRVEACFKFWGSKGESSRFDGNSSFQVEANST